MPLLDKVAIITGAGAGIGCGIARKLAKEGASVVVSDVDEEKAITISDEISSEGGDSIAVKMDVTFTDQIAAAIRSTLDKFGKIDILVNNAGVSSFAPILDMTEEDWDFNMNVNAKGVYLCTQPV